MKFFKLSAVALTVATTGSLVVPQTVNAHGYMDSPKARQAICEAQGGYWWPEDGSNIPNLACRAAFLESGHVQFIQEHEFSVNTADYLNQAAVEANVPNGTLCSAGSQQKRGMNLPSAEWQKTIVKPNAAGTIQVRYRATTPHNPSFWRFYLTKPSFNSATDELTWQDLELVQRYENVDFVVDADGKRFYEMQVSIPQDRVGDAILYSRWQRFDVVGEGFYNCSDITIERDGDNPIEWYPLAYFVRQGQDAQAGDSVQVRLFNETGKELVNKVFAITNENQAAWQSVLAIELNREFSQFLAIGVKNAAEEIEFDGQNIASNQVFATNSQYSYALSVIPAQENTAPIVNEIAAINLAENSQVNVHVHAFDDQNDPLTFSYQVPQPLSYQASGMDLTLSAPLVTNTQTVTVTVSVSDGQLVTTRSFPVTITDSQVDPELPIWQANVAYQAGDKVSYQNKAYRAKWWVKGETPDSSNAWESISNAGDDTWSATKAYQGGAIVTHQGVHYRARWWTQGEEPGTANVWQAQ